MTKKTDDDAAKTGGEHAETRILTPEQDPNTTRIMSDPEQQRQEQQQSKPPDPFSSTATIGDYRIIRKLGEGGMGVVYEAEQQHPRRLVALKVIRGGLHADDYHVKMFEREIQALARLKHPGIASIYESGLAEDGQIFFAMELVHGTTLTEFVEDAKLSGTQQMSDVDTQLELFSKICDVVSYAHQRGVIHRDLKPQNILVTADADEPSTGGSSSGKVGVKILDFGLARISDPDIAGDTSDLSQVGQIKGTLLYMSPEQVRARPDDIDVRSDVYSLGVMLYEMLSGRMPYDISQASLPEALRIICEEPPRSLRDADIASAGRSGRIDRDVETIVLKALEKEPDRRYQSVSAMMDDIDRYLTNQPILARPPSTYYQFRKLVARHKAAFASMATIFLLLLGFGVAMAAQSIRIANERDKALKAEQTADERKDEAENERKIAEDNFKRAEAEVKQRQIAEERLVAEVENVKNEKRKADEEKTKAVKAQEAEAEQRKIAETNLIEAQNQKSVADKQTTIATQQKLVADQKTVEANEQKTAAENEAEANRRLLYDSQIGLAKQAADQGDVSRINEILESQRPTNGKSDLRGFEWYHMWRLGHRYVSSFEQPGRVVAAGFSSGGSTLVTNFVQLDIAADTVTGHYQVGILDAVSGNQIETLNDRFLFAVSPSDDLLALSEGIFDYEKSQKGKIQLYNLKSKLFYPTEIPYVIGRPAAFSPNGKLLAVGAGSSSLMTEVWDVSIRRKVSSLNQTSDSFAAKIRFSPDSNSVAITGIYPKNSSDGGRGPIEYRLTIWDVATGRELVALKSDAADFWAVAFSTDGATLATGGTNGSVKLWDLKSGREVVEFRKSGGFLLNAISDLEFSPDKRTLAVANVRDVRLFDIATHNEISVIKGHTDSIMSLSFTPDGKMLMTASTDKSIRLWPIPYPDANTILYDQTDSIFSPDGKLLITTTLGKVNLWDFVLGKQLATLGPAKIDGSELIQPPGMNSSPTFNRSSSIFLSFSKFSHDGRIVAIPLRNSDVIELWDVLTQTRITAVAETVVDYSFSSRDDSLVTINFEGKVRRWDIAERKMTSSFEAIKPSMSLSEPPQLQLSPNGETLAAKIGKVLRLVDTTTGKDIIPTIDVSQNYLILQFSSDSNRLFLKPLFGPVTIMDVHNGQMWGPDTKTSGTGSTISIMSDDGRLIVLFNGNDVVVLNADAREVVARLKNAGKNVLKMAISHDGRRLAIATLDGIVIWDVSTQRPLMTLEGLFTNLKFAPDDRALIGTGVSGTNIWRAATDEEVQKQRGH